MSCLWFGFPCCVCLSAVLFGRDTHTHTQRQGVDGSGLMAGGCVLVVLVCVVVLLPVPFHCRLVLRCTDTVLADRLSEGSASQHTKGFCFPFCVCVRPKHPG